MILVTDEDIETLNKVTRKHGKNQTCPVCAVSWDTALPGRCVMGSLELGL